MINSNFGLFLIHTGFQMHLNSGLKVQIGQYSTKGVKEQNEDSLGCYVPEEPALTMKGMVALIADGVSSAEAGKEASEICVKNFLSDYYSTPDSWAVKTSAQRILSALNRWLYAQGMGYATAEQGYISTLSAMVIKSRTAHILHVGDSRVYRLRGDDFEQLTNDHATRVNKNATYLTRAMGMDLMLDVDYYTEEVFVGDLFFLSTDGVHDFLSDKDIKATITAAKVKSIQCNSINSDRVKQSKHTEPEPYQQCCKDLVAQALENNSDDNLSCQIVNVEELPQANADDTYIKLSDLPFPPFLSAGITIDGYRILDELHASNRSQVYYVEDIVTKKHYVMKTPSRNFDEDIAYKERFVMEPWITGRIISDHVVKVHENNRTQNFLFNLYDFVEGIPLTQWINQHPKPSIDITISLVRQIIKGLRAMHRKETLHQDIKPANVIIGKNNHVTIIDFGSSLVAGIAEIETAFEREHILGTDTYAAPEYKLKRKGTLKSDMFSLAVVTYEMLTGQHPFGSKFGNSHSTHDFYRLKYQPARDYNPMVPIWMDGALEKALKISPDLRYEALSEFEYDLTHPNKDFLDKSHTPIAERDPLLFWQGISGILVALELLTLWFWLG